MGSNIASFLDPTAKAMKAVGGKNFGDKWSPRGTVERQLAKVTGDKDFARAIAKPESLFTDKSQLQPAPLAPLQKRDDPAVLAARERLRLAELSRRGRASTNLTSGFGTTAISRPIARQAQLLGE